MSLGLDIPCKDWYPDKPRTMPLYIRSFPRLGQTEYCVHSYLRIPYFNIMKFTLLGPHAFLYELPMEQIRVPEPHDQVDTVSPGEHQAVITNIYFFCARSPRSIVGESYGIFSFYFGRLLKIKLPFSGCQSSLGELS
jgi:hypothetical protein